MLRSPECRQADTLPSWLSFTVLLDESAAALEQQLYSVLGQGENTSLALLTLDEDEQGRTNDHQYCIGIASSVVRRHLTFPRIS